MGRKPKAAGGAATPINPELRTALPMVTSEVEEQEPAEDGLFTWQDGPDVRIRIDRQDDVVKKLVFHGYVSQEQATESYIGAQLGGGNYRAQLTQRDTGTGRWMIRRQRYFAVPGSYKPPERPLGSMKPAAGRPEGEEPTRSVVEPDGLAANPNAILSNALVSQVMDLMKVSKQPTPSMDWGPIIVAALGLVERFMARQAVPVVSPGVDVLTQQIQELRTTVAALAAKPGAPGSSASAIGDVVAALQQLRGVSELLGGGGGRDDEDDTLKTLGTQMIGLMIGQQGAPAPAQLPPGPAAPMPVGTRPELVREGAPTVLTWQLLIRPYAGHLANAAEENFDPSDVAEGVYRLMPSRFLPSLETLLAIPNAASLVMTEIPRLQPHGEWVQGLVDALRAIQAAPDDPDDAEDPG